VEVTLSKLISEALLKRPLHTTFRYTISSFVAILVAIAVPHDVQAASANWTGGGSDALWSNGSNWSATPVPGSGDTATFNAAAGVGGTVISLGGIQVRNITFDSASAASYTLGSGVVGSQTFTLGDGANAGAITMNSGVSQNQLINAAITLGDSRVAATYSIINNSSADLKLAGNLAGNNVTGTAGFKTISVEGAGSTTLGGNLSLGGASALRLSKTGSGSLNLAGSSLGSSGAAALHSVALNDVGSINMSDSSVMYLLSGSHDSITSRYGGVISGGTMNWGSTANRINSAAGTLTINSTISGAGPKFLGSGLIKLNGNNSFSDAATIGAGSVAVSTIGNGGAPSPFGLNTTINLAEGHFAGAATLRYTGSGETSSRTINLNSTGSSVANIEQAGTGLLKFTSDVTANPHTGGLTSNSKILTLRGSTSGEGEISGAITDYTASLETEINKTGTGKWTLSGNNTFTGRTTLDAGTLVLDYSINNSSKLSSTAVNGVLALNGGTLDLVGGSHTETVLSTTLTTGTTLIKQTGGTSKLSMGAITFSSGVIDFSADNIATTTSANDATRGILNLRSTVAGTDYARNDGSGNIVAFASYTNFAITPRSANFVYSLAGSGSFATFVNMSGTGMKITTTGAGQSLALTADLFLGSMIFAGADDYAITTSGSGNFRPTRLLHYGAGTLSVGRLNANLDFFGTGKTILTTAANGNSTISIFGGTVQFSDNLQIGTDTSAQAITLNNGTLIANTTGGNIALNNAGNFSRTFVVNAGGGTIDVIGGNTLTISGVISGSGPLSLGSASSSGTIALSATNTHNGDTTIKGGTVLLMSGSGSFSNNVYLTITGGTLDLGGNTQLFAGWYGPSIQGGSIVNGTINSLSDYDAQAGSVSAVLTGVAGLTKTSGGTVTLSGANTYTGPTIISAGTLALSGSGSIAGRNIIVGSGATLNVSSLSSDFTLGAGQTLKGAGTVAGDLVIGSDATLSPGLAAVSVPEAIPGTISNTGGTVTYAGGGHYDWEINSISGSQGTSPGWDHHNITGSLVISATSGNKFRINVAGLTSANELGLVSGWNPNDDHTWTIATASGGISGFSADKFIVDASTFTAYNSVGDGTFVVQVSGNNLQVKFNKSTLAVGSYWGLAGAGDWSTSAASWIYSEQGIGTLANWNNGDDAIFSAVGSGTGSFGVNVATVSANSITVNQGEPTFNNGTITLAGTEGLAQAGHVTLNVPATINSVIAGTIGMTKAGDSTLTLAGANTYTGQTTINAGTLQVGSGGTSGSLNPASAINNNSTLSFNRSDTITQGTDFGAISGVGLVSKNVTGTLVLNSANSYSGGTVLNAGTISVGSNSALGSSEGDLTMGANTTLSLNGNTVSIGNLIGTSGAMTISSGTLEVSGDIAVGNGSTTAALGTVNLTGSGQTITLYGNQPDFLGTLNIGSSTMNLIFDAANELGLGMNMSGSGDIHATGLQSGIRSVSLEGNNSGWTGDLYIHSGHVRHTSVNGLSAANVVYFTDVGPHPGLLNLATSGTIGGLSGNSGTVRRQNSNTTTLTIDTGGNSYTFGGALDFTAGGLALTKTGAGTQTLTGSGNTYNGLTTISGGTLRMSGSGVLGASAGNLTLSGGTLDLGGTSQSKGALNITAAASSGNTIENGDLTATSYTANLASGNAIITANLLGAANLTKSSTGILTLSGANTYSGTTTINGGILSVNTINSVSTPTPSGSSSLGVPSSAANGTIAINNGTLLYNGTAHETSDRVINLSGTTGGATIDQSGTGALKFTSDLTATGNGAKTLTLQGSTSGTGELGGVVPNSGGGNTALAKAGTGTWILSGNNTYSGATAINGGTLWVNGTHGGAGAWTVASGATLGGSGVIPGTVAVSGSMSPGSTVNTIGTLNVNSAVTWNGGNTFASANTDWKFGLATGSNDADLLNITGNFTKGSGSHFRFDFGGTGEAGRTYKLVDWTGSTTFTAANFSIVNLPANLAAEFQINGTQLDLVLISCTSPTITLGANPSVCQGITSASLTYSAFTGGPTTYTIDYDDAANAAGFVDVTTPVALNAAPSSISLSVPVAASAGVYSATLYINNGPCRGSASFSVIVTDVPALPGVITQSNPAGSTVCKDSIGVMYSVAAVSGATGYTWTVPSGATITNGQGTAQIYVNWNAVAGGATEVKVKANNACGDGAERSTTFTLINGVPGAPTAMNASEVSLTSFLARWQAPVSGGAVGGYLLDVSSSIDFTSGMVTENLSLGPSATNYVLTSLESGVTYYYRVRAFNACGNSGYSDTITALTPQVLAAWNVSGLTGGSGNYGASPLSPTTYAVGDVTVVGLTRGSGVTQAGTAVARGWGGTAWNSASVANAVSANQFATLQLQATSGRVMSFFSINKLDYRRSSIGASSGELQYSLNGAPFAFAASLSYPSNAVTGDSHPPIDLTGVTALQDVPSGSPVIFRIVNHGAANATEPWYIYDTANSSAHDLEILGIICETPVAYNVTGGGVYCSVPGTGSEIRLQNSQLRVTYTLYRAGNPTPVATVSGTGGQISFGYFTTVGTYSVTATRNSGGCAAEMNNSVDVSLSISPGVPTNLVGSDTIDDKTKLDWTAPSGDTVTGYNVKRSTTEGGSYTTIGANVQVATFTVDSGSPGVTYYYKVSALNGGCESSDTAPLAAQWPGGCPNDEPPVWTTVANKTVSAGQSFTHSVIASENSPLCAAPDITWSTLPGWMDTPVLTDDENISTLSFSGFPQSENAGAYPVTVTASDGILSTSRSFMIFVNATNVANWSVKITDIDTPVSGTAGLTWQSTAGVKYDVWSSTQPVGGSPSWQMVADVSPSVAVGNSIEATFPASDIPAGQMRFYQVAPSGVSRTDRGVWGVVRPSIPAANISFMSPPLAGSDLDFGGNLGRIMTNALTTLGSKIYIMVPGTGGPDENGDAIDWIILERADSGWQRFGGGALPVLSPGQGFMVHNFGGVASPTFSGPVGNVGTNSIQLAGGTTANPAYNIIGISEGKGVAASTAFDGISVVGSFDENLADQVVIMNSNGSWRRLIRRPDGTWYDTGNPNGQGETSLILMPGQAYYYIRRGGGATVNF
jgi:autotransporter-associated beta strand protein